MHDPYADCRLHTEGRLQNEKRLALVLLHQFMVEGRSSPSFPENPARASADRHASGIRFWAN